MAEGGGLALSFGVFGCGVFLYFGVLALLLMIGAGGMAVGFQNRIMGLRSVVAGELRGNPLNWRKHPKRQREALGGMLREVGWAD